MDNRLDVTVLVDNMDGYTRLTATYSCVVIQDIELMDNLPQATVDEIIGQAKGMMRDMVIDEARAELEGA